MICIFGYPADSKTNSEVTSYVNQIFKKNFKNYIDNSATIVDKNPISFRIITYFDGAYTDMLKIEKKIIEVMKNFGDYPNTRFIDETDTHTIIYEIHNPEEKESSSNL